MDELRVSLVQQASGPDPETNRAALAEITPTDTDLVVFPEAFARDFGPPTSPLGRFAEPLDGPFATTVAAAAEQRRTTVVAGMFEVSTDPDRPFNTLVLRGAGARADYRKIHLYDSFGFKESDRLTAGAVEPVVVEVSGWQVGLMTCYDLRFPELARRLVDAGAEVLVVAAAWVAGDRKVDHWRTLLRARAIENTAYVVAAAQPGPRYCGHSLVAGPLGEILVEAGEATEVVSATLERSDLATARDTNPSLRNRRL